jgi:hypothetical protein
MESALYLKRLRGEVLPMLGCYDEECCPYYWTHMGSVFHLKGLKRGMLSMLVDPHGKCFPS